MLPNNNKCPSVFFSDLQNTLCCFNFWKFKFQRLPKKNKKYLPMWVGKFSKFQQKDYATNFTARQIIMYA
jgi:hypothetical protein